MQLSLVNAAGRTACQDSRAMGYGVFPPAAWPLDGTVTERSRFVVGAAAPPGRYSLMLSLAWKSAFYAEGTADTDDPDAPERIRIASIEVRPRSSR